MAKRPLEDVALADLLTYYSMADLAFLYYDNDAKANVIENVDIFNEANKKIDYYLVVRRAVFDEIERRLHDKPFDQLVKK